jgi:hypothetical protein
MERICLSGQFGVSTIHRQDILGQVVGAYREEGDFTGELIG